MFDFSAQAVTAETIKEYQFDMIPGAPSLMMAPAHDSNPAYLDARLRDSIAESDRLSNQPRKPAEKPTPASLKAQIDEARSADRVLLAETCVKGWGKAPRAADGSTPAFSPENGAAFINALPDYMFDGLRNWAMNLYNFLDRPPVSDEDARKLGN